MASLGVASIQMDVWIACLASDNLAGKLPPTRPFHVLASPHVPHLPRHTSHVTPATSHQPRHTCCSRHVTCRASSSLDHTAMGLMIPASVQLAHPASPPFASTPTRPQPQPRMRRPHKNTRTTPLYACRRSLR
eukprot:326675-Chlamydomonas_euryale.AAC.1